MQELVPDEYLEHHKVSKRAVFHGNYGLLVRAIFSACRPPHTHQGLQEASRLEVLLQSSIADDCSDAIKQYVGSLRGMSEPCQPSPKTEEQHAFSLMLFAQMLNDLVDFHGGKEQFDKRIEGVTDEDIARFISAVELSPL